MATITAVRHSTKEVSSPTFGDAAWTLVCAALALVVVELMLVPLNLPGPMPTSGSSWRMAVCEAFAQHLRFGSDFVFTMGPLSFLYADMPHPATYWISACLWCVIGFTWWLELRVAARSLIGTSAGQFAFVVVMTILLVDTNQLAYGLLLLGVFNREFLSLPPNWKRDALWGTAMALLALAKFSLFGTAGAVLLVGSLLSRRYWLSLLAWAAGLLAGWLAAGQQLIDLPSYLRNSVEIASGYAIAMSTESLKDTLLIFVLWLGLPLIATILLVFAARRATLRQIARILIIQVIACLAIQKLTCTRMESAHLFVATQVWLAQAGLLYLLIRRQEQERWQSELVAAILGTMLGVALWCTSVTLGNTNYLLTRIANVGGSLWCLLSGQFPANRYYVAKDLLRAEYAVPKLKGTVDVFPDDCAAAMAAGEYRGRPVLQAYSAYSRPLDEMNARFLRSDQAPKFLLFEPGGIDERYPMLADSQSWLEMIARYGTKARLPRFELLERRPVSPYSLEPLATFPGLLKHSFSTPWSKDDLLWAAIDVRPTVLGSLQAFVFHIMPPVINVTYGDGSFKSYRIPINMASAGFLLSPVVLSGDEMSRLIEAKRPGALPEQRRIAGFVIDDSENKLPWAVYKSQYTVHLDKVVFSQSDRRGAEGAAMR